MKFQERVKAVREAFDVNMLAEICMADEDYFAKYGSAFRENEGKGKFAFYCKEDNSDVLAIAHLDSVQKGKDFGVAKYVSGKEIVLSPTLDDRLGAYVICELLPKLGIKTDLLLTTDEERGQSTARLFKTDKTYKWMFQFDRMGDDVVMYQYDTPALRTKLVDAGFKCANGSASDISKLADLGCSGMNFGVGYEDYHYERAYADLNVLFLQVARFMKFHHKYQREHLVYEKKTYVVSSPTSGSHGSWSAYDTGHSYGSNDYETQFGARRDGIWFSNMVWDETRQMHLPNPVLYKTYPTAALPTVKRIIDANEKWDTKTQKFVICDGRHTEEEVLKAAQEILEGAGHTQVILPLALLEEHKEESRKLEASWNGSSSNASISEGSIDDPCQCGHSRFVHHRTIWAKGGRPVNHAACDWWKCSCAGFEEKS